MRRWVGGYAFAVALLSTLSASAQFVALPPVPATSATLRPAGYSFLDVLPFGSGFVANIGAYDDTSLAMLDASATLTTQIRRNPTFSNRITLSRAARTPTGFLLFGHQFMSDFQLRVQVVNETGSFVGAGTRIATVSNAEGSIDHRVACAATNCLLVWRESGAIRAIRVTHAGALIDPTPFTVSTTTSAERAATPGLATDGVDYLVAYSKFEPVGSISRGVWVQRIEAATGALLGGAPTRASSDSAISREEMNMHVVFHNERYAVAWLGGSPAVRVFDRNATPIAADVTRIDISADVSAGTSATPRGVLSVGALSDDRFVLAWHLGLVTRAGEIRDAVYTRAVTRDQTVVGARSNLIDGEFARTSYLRVAHGASSTVVTWVRFPEGITLPPVSAATRLGADGEALDDPPLVAYRTPSQQSGPQFTRLSDGTSVLTLSEQFGLDPVDGARSGVRAVRISAQGVVLTPVPLDLGRSSIPPKIVAGAGQFLAVRGDGPYVEYRRYSNDFLPIDAGWRRANGATNPAIASIANDYLWLNHDGFSTMNRAGFILDAMDRFSMLPSHFPYSPFALTANSTHWLLFVRAEASATHCIGSRVDRAGVISSFLWEKPVARSCEVRSVASDPWGITLLSPYSMIRLDPSGAIRGETLLGSTLNFATITRAPGVSILAEVHRDPNPLQFDISVVSDSEPPTVQRNLFTSPSFSDVSLSTGHDRIFVAFPQDNEDRVATRVVFRTIPAALPAPPPLPPMDVVSAADASTDVLARPDSATPDDAPSDSDAHDAGGRFDVASEERADATTLPDIASDRPATINDAIAPDGAPLDGSAMPPRPAGSCSCDTRSLGTPARHAVLLLAAATTLTLRRRRRAA